MDFVKDKNIGVYRPREPRILSMPFDPKVVARGGGDEAMADPRHAECEFMNRGSHIGAYKHWLATFKARPYADLDFMLFLKENGNGAVSGLEEIFPQDMIDLAFLISKLRRMLDCVYPGSNFIFNVNNHGPQQTIKRPHVHVTDFSSASPIDPTSSDNAVAIPEILVDLTGMLSERIKDIAFDSEHVIQDTYPMKLKLGESLAADVCALHRLTRVSADFREEVAKAHGKDFSYIFSLESNSADPNLLSIGIGGMGIGSTEMRGVTLHRYPDGDQSFVDSNRLFLARHIQAVFSGLAN